MATFKVTLHIQDGLTLGHVLMTKGVELIHIVETNDTIKLIEHESIKPDGRRVMFKHPSGKTAQEMVIEYMKTNHSIQYSWNTLQKHIMVQGFSKGSINNAIVRLLNRKQIKRVDVGKYMISSVKEKVA
jgi:hypothetical protein